MTAVDARSHTPSVSELQAALLAARQGAFASVPAAATVDPQTLPASAGGQYNFAAQIVEAARPSLRSAVRPPAPARPAGNQGQGLWLLGTHGGSGARCLSAVLPGTRYAGRGWPVAVGGRERVVLVCRTSQRGLVSAQDHAREFRDDGALRDRLDLLGVIVSADAPGRIPPALRRLERLLSGAVPILGEIPWQPAWRLAAPVRLEEPPTWLAKVQQAIAEAVPR
jgi:hypothetical protein